MQAYLYKNYGENNTKQLITDVKILEKIIVRKSPPLDGYVKIDGSKNSALPILAAALLCEGESVIKNVPRLSDTELMCSLLESLGASVSILQDGIHITVPRIKSHIASYEYVSKMRASFLVMGPMLAKTGRARVSLPGGCPIGQRPVNLHLKGFAAMGAKIINGHGYAEAKCDKLNASKIYLDFPSVGATENIMMAACVTQGQTIIENAASEPEIIDLADFLNKAGAKITGAGSDTLCITGTERLTGCRHTIIPDRIEAGTFMAAAAATRGCITLKNIIPEHLSPVTAKLREMGVQISEDTSSVCVDASARLKNIDIKTLPYPGFPTDMQAQMAALMCRTDGSGMVVETIFENRFLYVPELTRMGAHIKIDGRSAIIEGVRTMAGTSVNATDLRSGAALIVAGLSAKGDTEIGNIFHIDRGYCDIAGKLKELGAKIDRT